MKKFFNSLATKLLFPIRQEKGQGMVEYGLIIALVAVVVIGALIFVGNSLHGRFSSIASTISKPQ